MTAVNKQLLQNILLLKEAKKLQKMGFISNDQLDLAKIELPVPSSHYNLLFRLGFFILGSMLYSSISGVITLFTATFTQDNFEIITLFIAIIGIIISEFLAKRNYYRFGLDDAFILGFQVSFLGFIWAETGNIFSVFIVMVFLGVLCAVRYVNSLSALISCTGITGAIVYSVLEYHVIDKLFLPFILFFLAVGIYFIFHRLNKITKFNVYKNAFLMLQIFSLILGYLSMNYLVVRELSEKLMNIKVTPGNDIPFSFLFYVFTFLVPLLLFIYSLKTKNRNVLYIGFLTLTFSFFTIRYYYALVSTEIALILGGFSVFLTTYFCIKKLKNKDFGITFKPDSEFHGQNQSNSEALLSNSQIDLKPKIPIHQNMPFGGGGYSGGGATGGF